MTRYSRHPRSERQRARILAAIAVEPLTAQQLADRLHLSRDGVNLHLAKMKAMKPRLIHVSGHVYNPLGGRPAPQYSPGDKLDANYTSSRAPTRHNRVSEQLALAKKELGANPMTAANLGLKLGIRASRARFYIAKLRATKQAYIKDWIPMAAGSAPIYAVGDKPDAPRRQITGQEAWAKKKARRKKDDAAQAQYDKELARRRLDYRIERCKSKPNSWLGALSPLTRQGRDAA